jgi:hypothetical protein
MTNFDRAMGICGLSTRAGAEIFDCEFSRVVAWRLGQEEAPEAVWDMLADLYSRIDEAAVLAQEAFAEREIEPLEFGKGITVDIEGDDLPVGVQYAAGTLATLRHLHERAQTRRPWWEVQCSHESV